MSEYAFNKRLGYPVGVAFLIVYERILHIRIHGYCDICRHCPGSRGPDQKIFFLFAFQGEFQIERIMRYFFIILCQDLMLGDSGFATRTPRNNVTALVNPSFFMTYLENMPDHIIILIRHGVVGMIPIHEVSKPLTLLGLD